MAKTDELLNKLQERIAAAPPAELSDAEKVADLEWLLYQDRGGDSRDGAARQRRCWAVEQPSAWAAVDFGEPGRSRAPDHGSSLRMAAKRPDKNSPARPAGGTSTGTTRLKALPRKVGPVWTLSEHERERFERLFGASEIAKKALARVHPDDHVLLVNGIAAVLSFHELSKIIDQLEWTDGNDDLVDDLRHIRVGFELALQALDASLKTQGLTLDRRKEGGVARWKNDPRSKAMAEIRDAWERAGRPGAAAFARKVHAQYADIITSERSIETAIGRWRREASSS